MTETEAQSFVQDVLKGYWPDWEPTDVIYGLWVWKLRKFDYGKAKAVVGELFCEKDYADKYAKKQPPISKILKSLLLKKAYGSLRRARPEPVLVFEVICEDWQKAQYSIAPFKRKYGHWEESLAKLKARDPHEIEQEAERCRQWYIRQYGGNWIVNRLWMQYFEEGSIPI